MLAHRYQGRVALAVFVSLLLVLLLYVQRPRTAPFTTGDKFVPSFNTPAALEQQQHPPSPPPPQQPPKQPSPPPEQPSAPVADPAQQPLKVQLVVASIKKEDTSWVKRHFAEWQPQVYVADDSQAALSVANNKGREAMVYLTYMIDHYDSLPDSVVFIHASRFAWHNDDPDYDALPTLRNLQLDYVREAGYVNLRCVWVIGCPNEIRPFDDAGDKGRDGKSTTKGIYKQAFEEILPELPVPELVAVSCCSQFAVSRETIRARPKADYVRYRDWLTSTPLSDGLSGRVFEFAWHIIFGKEAYFCPDAKVCYCKVFGMCDLPCDEKGCEGRYILPPSSTLPKGWPLIGWDKQERKFNGTLE